MSSSVQARKATRDDLDFVVSCNVRCARESEGLELEHSRVVPGTLAVFDRPERGVYFVAEADEQRVGSLLVTFEWSDWRNQPIWWLQSVYVESAWRGRGVFAAMYATVEQHARLDNAAEIRLYLDRHNERAKRAYTKLGFAESHYDILAVDLL